MGETWLTRWFKNDAYTPMAHVLIAFCSGVLLAPWGSGLFFLILFIILYEIFFYIFTHEDSNYWQSEIRASVINASVAGWIIGRQVTGKPILKKGVP